MEWIDACTASSAKETACSFRTWPSRFCRSQTRSGLDPPTSSNWAWPHCWWRSPWRGVHGWRPTPARLAQRPGWSILLLAALPVVLRLLLLPHHPAPVPDIYDEFSHLLVADTLRHFRLANPAHPLHRFFETFFVLQEPTYSSIYPMGQGAGAGLRLDDFRHALGRGGVCGGRALRALLLDAARLDHARLGAHRRPAGRAWSSVRSTSG